MQLRQVIGVRQEMVTQPQQILRSELIQTPLLQLEARFQQEFEQNPLLEIAEEIEQRLEEDSDDRLESNAVRDAVLEGEDADAREAEREEREPDWEQIFDDQEDDRQFYRANRAVTEPVEIPQADVETLADQLRSQLRLDRFDDLQMEIGEIIIGSLDTRGYLDTPLDIIAGIANTDEEKVEEVLWRIQRYDPPGIAARSLQECLMVQAELKWGSDHYNYRILSEHYENFINRRYENIANTMDISPQMVQEAFGEVRDKLNPRPGEGVINEKMNYIIPDLIVEVSQANEDEDPEFLVMLNDGNIPSFYINEELKKLILKRDTDKKAREYAVQKAESARWFINAIMQRRTTMVRTMRAIVDRQKPWFKTGKEEHLKPMILQDVADDIEMDISTISRVTRDKYVQTPYGVRELKYFFNDRMETSSGDEVATRTIKSKLREVIEAEDKKKPLSDQAIADLLAKEGFPIARRTVQKYREQLGIPVKRLRRQV
jgi:RNA polymerase sigma-54 factor